MDKQEYKRKLRRKTHMGKDTVVREDGEVIAEYHRFRENARKTQYVTMYLDDDNLYEAYKGLGSQGMVWGYIMKKYDHDTAVFSFSSTVKDNIIAVTGLSVGTIRSAVKGFVDNDMLLRIVGADYMINPNLFYKGIWENRPGMIDLYAKLKSVSDRRKAIKDSI